MEQRLPRQITMIVLRLAGVSTIFIELIPSVGPGR